MKRRRLRVGFRTGESASHQRLGLAFKEILLRHHDVVDDVTEADLVFLQAQGDAIGRMVRRFRRLRTKYLIAYFLFEAGPLPDEVADGIGMVDEVWAGSRHCAEIAREYHRQVSVIPHVVHCNVDVPESARREMAGRIAHRPGRRYYLHVSRLIDLRKGSLELLSAFQRLREKLPEAHLLLKTWTMSEDERQWARREVERLFPGGEGITHIDDFVSPDELGALFQLADVVVSAHHAEGWNLSLADAMLHGRLTVATAYSGNLDFMTPQNSLLVDYRLEHIRPEHE